MELFQGVLFKPRHRNQLIETVEKVLGQGGRV